MNRCARKEIEMNKRKVKAMTRDLVFTGCLVFITIYIGPIYGAVSPLSAQLVAFIAGRTAVKFVNEEYEDTENQLVSELHSPYKKKN